MTTASQNSVKYRPGRIQSLNGEQEVILKQVWAYYLKFWGYEVNIPNEDLAFKESFVPSSTTTSLIEPTGLARTATSNSVNSTTSYRTSGTSASTKKKRGLFGNRKNNIQVATPPADSKRMKQIQAQSSFEVYQPVEKPSEGYYNIYNHYYKEGFEYSDDYESTDSEDNVSDMESLDTFITASTSITNSDDISFYPSIANNSKSYGVKGPSDGNINSLRNVTAEPNVTILPILSQYKPMEIHNSFFSAVRNDLIDNYFLRFIRARKFDTENAIHMFSKSLIWRRRDFPADKWVLEGDAPSYVNGTNKGLIKNFTVSKSAIRGEDKNGNPVFIVQSKKHFGSDSPLDETQRFAVLTIEWCRLFLREVNESVDQCSVVFDLTGFSLKNADYASIKFLAEVFEAHYPEFLGSIIIYNAPWIFSTVWNIIKNWLDPVVASKIHFAKDLKELQRYIAIEHIPHYLGGKDSYQNDYPKPNKSHVVPPLKKGLVYRKLRKERDELFVKLLETTRRWVESTSPNVSAKYFQDKIDLNIQLSENYLKLDPYIRNPGMYDRNNSLKLRN